MADRLAHLFREWHCLGGAVLLANAGGTYTARAPEAVIAESTAWCRASGRLTWIVVDWLIRHADEIDTAALLDLTRRRGDLSVLGVLCDAANSYRPHPGFEAVMSACPPNPVLEPFFSRVARSPLASRLARENALDLFLRWNYLCGELRYLSDDRQPAMSGEPLAARTDTRRPA